MLCHAPDDNVMMIMIITVITDGLNQWRLPVSVEPSLRFKVILINVEQDLFNLERISLTVARLTRREQLVCEPAHREVQHFLMQHYLASLFLNSPINKSSVCCPVLHYVTK